MDFALTDQQEAIRDAIAKICEGFPDAYWLKKDHDGGFPHDFHKALADAGWLGICVPEAYGGSGLGITEAAIMMRAIAESGAGMSGASAVHINVFGLNPVVVFGTEEQRKRMLPPMVEGREKACFAVTEPNTGLNTTQLKTRAVAKNDRYIVNGQKVWISTAQVAHKILLLARTTPLEEVRSPTHGLSLFYTDFDRNKIKVHEIEKMGRKIVDSNELFFEDFEIPMEDRIGEEGKGFQYILEGMNPERNPDRGGSGRPRQGRAVARHRIRQDPRCVQPAYRQEPGHPASAGHKLGRARSGVADGDVGGVAIRQGHALRRCRQCREIHCG
ncbi:alkylation response protein AidB-like acyl-CoA dehydrogenase [Bradyrhizobium sp. LM3.2]